MTGEFDVDIPPEPPTLVCEDDKGEADDDIPQKKRFVAPQSDTEVDDLANQRQAKETIPNALGGQDISW